MSNTAHNHPSPRRHRSGPAGSRVAIAITAVIVTAVVVAGGLAVALPGRNSVKTDDIARNAVKGRHIATEAVGSSDIADNSITSDDIADQTIQARDIADGAIQRDALDDPLKPHWARVQFTGGASPSSASLVTGLGVDSATRVGPGAYRVTFATDVRACAWTATLNNADAGTASPGEIAVERAISENINDLLVRTYDSAGTQTELAIGDAFSVVLTCGGAIPEP